MSCWTATTGCWRCVLQCLSNGYLKGRQIDRGVCTMSCRHLGGPCLSCVATTLYVPIYWFFLFFERHKNHLPSQNDSRQFLSLVMKRNWMNGNATKGDIINLETNTFKIARAQLTKYQYCRFCNSGSYQNEIGALVCKACPAGTTTMILGTKQLSGLEMAWPSLESEQVLNHCRLRMMRMRPSLPYSNMTYTEHLSV